MVDVPTPNIALTKPIVGASRGTWGNTTNANWDTVDSVFDPDGEGTDVGLKIGAGKKLVIAGTVEGFGPGAGITTGAIQDEAVTYPKIQDVSATDKVLGRATAGAGTVEEISCTAAGRAVIAAADAAAQRDVLGVPGFDDPSNVFTSTDAGATPGPLWTLDRASPSPAVNDELGRFSFGGRDSTAAPNTFAAFGARIIDPVTKDGALGLWSLVGGVETRSFQVWKGIYAETLADKGAGTANVVALYQGNSPTALVPRGHIDGLTMTNAADIQNDITVSDGEATGATRDWLLRLPAPITKRLDANWVVGDNQGGLDQNSKVGDTWYHVHLIARIDTGVVDVLFSTLLAPVMPAGYGKRRRIGSIYNRGSGLGINPFSQVGGYFEWETPVVDVDDGTPTNVAKARTLTVPIDVIVLADISPFHKQGSNASITAVSSLATIGQAAQSANADNLTLPGTVGPGEPNRWQVAGRMMVRTNNSAKIRTRAEDDTTRTGILTHGWFDFRGKS
jgi:hypothetical protein